HEAARKFFDKRRRLYLNGNGLWRLFIAFSECANNTRRTGGGESGVVGIDCRRTSAKTGVVGESYSLSSPSDWIKLLLERPLNIRQHFCQHQSYTHMLSCFPENFGTAL